jgi:dTMP kinase
MIVVFEGLDTSGKSTQINKVKDYLSYKGFSMLTLKDPGSTEVGEKLRSILLDPNNNISNKTEALLFAAARQQMIDECILDKELSDTILLLDRFIDSSIVYQSIARNLDEMYILEINKSALKSVNVDLKVYMRLTLEEYIRRQRTIKDRMEQIDNKVIHKMIAKYDQMYLDKPNVVTVDSTDDIDSNTKLISANIISRLILSKLS